MTRRLILALVGTVLATLVVAAAVTVVIVRSQATATTEDRLREQAGSVASLVAVAAADQDDARAQQIARQLARELRQSLRVDGIELVGIGPRGRVSGSLPDGVRRDDLVVGSLRDGTTLSGSNDGVVWAAAPTALPSSTVVAVVTSEARTDLADAVPWFLAAAAATLLVGAAVAVWLGRRLGRPVRDASRAAERIAAGDLSTRLPERGRQDDELAELSRSLNTMADALERSRTLDQQFLLSVSHDLRTPLTSIRGYAEAITDGTASDPADAATVITTEAGRLERLVGDLLTLARLDARAFPLHPVDVDVREPVIAAVRAFAPAAATAGLVVELTGVTVAATVLADPSRLEQVLGNVLANAGHFARRRIDVTVLADGDAWVVRVDDDGPGIAPHERERVFDRLYSTRNHPTRAEVGSGLGLAIVEQLTTAMGGTVTAGEAAGGGARIEVRLPSHFPDRSVVDSNP